MICLGFDLINDEVTQAGRNFRFTETRIVKKIIITTFENQI